MYFARVVSLQYNVLKCYASDVFRSFCLLKVDNKNSTLNLPNMNIIRSTSSLLTYLGKCETVFVHGTVQTLFFQPVD